MVLKRAKSMKVRVKWRIRNFHIINFECPWKNYWNRAFRQNSHLKSSIHIGPLYEKLLRELMWTMDCVWANSLNEVENEIVKDANGWCLEISKTLWLVGSWNFPGGGPGIFQGAKNHWSGPGNFQGGVLEFSSTPQKIFFNLLGIWSERS